jgi:YHS domain-containing protein
MAKDPVCGRDLDFTIHTDESFYAGWAVYFCGPECKAKFDRNPEVYKIEHAVSVAGEKHKFEI